MCRAAAKAFKANVERANGILMIPGHAFMGGMDWQRSIISARDDMVGFEKQFTDEEFSERREKLTDDSLGKLKILQSERSSDASIKQFYQSCYNVEVFSRENKQVRDWIQDVLKSSVIQSWTAYEVLAADLLTKIVDRHTSLDTRSRWTSEQRRFSLFTSRKGISNRYRWTFNIDNADILLTVDNPAIHALGTLRNVLVHAGGKIDKQFQDDRKGFDIWGSKTLIPIPLLRLIRGRRIGYEIPFSGPLIRQFINPSVTLGFGLVNAVDKWLIAHP